jgi:hypothetical protein
MAGRTREITMREFDRMLAEERTLRNEIEMAHRAGSEQETEGDAQARERKQLILYRCPKCKAEYDYQPDYRVCILCDTYLELIDAGGEMMDWLLDEEQIDELCDEGIEKYDCDTIPMVRDVCKAQLRHITKRLDKIYDKEGGQGLLRAMQELLKEAEQG